MKILDHLIESLRKAGEYNRHDTAAPSAVLWPDGERRWEGVAAQLLKLMPELIVLSSDIDEKQGPGTFIRYLISKHKGKNLPVIYLPGVSRQHFRSASGFPEIAKHLFPLQFLGRFWTQDNGKDWTLSAFLTSENGGLGLDLARDKSTEEALSEQIETLLGVEIEELRGKKIGADDLNEMGAGDSIRLLLEWMENPKKAEKKWGKEEKKGFTGLCKKEYGFDPEKDGVVIAIEKLMEGEGKWLRVWQRFEESYTSYPELPKALKSFRPSGLFDQANPRSPFFNQSQEVSLKEELGKVKELPFKDAQAKLTELSATHGVRAEALWAKLGEAPLAIALKYLHSCSMGISRGLVGNSWDEIGQSYLADGWKIDRDARQAFNAVRSAADVKAVTCALQATYGIWLDELASRVQAWVGSYPKKEPKDAASFPVESGTIYLFVDGFRAELAQELIENLKERKLRVASELNWSALPSVTATAKPAWKPMAEKIKGEEIGEGFQPSSAKTGKAFETNDFRKGLKELGFEYLKQAEVGDPEKCGWTEIITFDQAGHAQEAKLAWRIKEEMDGVLSRIDELIEAGWRRIIIATDHGWLWLPGEFPKIDLPKHLTAARWGRCAIPKPGSQYSLPRVGWFWNPVQEVAMAPGAGFFGKATYGHGGVSIQECLTLKIQIEVSQQAGSKEIQIASAKWARLKLVVNLSGAALGISVDIRSRANDPKSSLLAGGGKEVDAGGKATLFVENEDTEGQAAFLVVTRNDEVLAKQNVTIGEN